MLSCFWAVFVKQADRRDEKPDGPAAAARRREERSPRRCATLVVPSTVALYFVVGVGGLAYGMFWTLNPTLAAEISGLKHLGSNYAFLSLSPAAAGYAFNAGLAAALYVRSHINFVHIN